MPPQRLQGLYLRHGGRLWLGWSEAVEGPACHCLSGLAHCDLHHSKWPGGLDCTSFPSLAFSFSCTYSELVLRMEVQRGCHRSLDAYHGSRVTAEPHLNAVLSTHWGCPWGRWGPWVEFSPWACLLLGQPTDLSLESLPLLHCTPGSCSGHSPDLHSSFWLNLMLIWLGAAQSLLWGLTCDLVNPCHFNRLWLELCCVPAAQAFLFPSLLCQGAPRSQLHCWCYQWTAGALESQAMVGTNVPLCPLTTSSWGRMSREYRTRAGCQERKPSGRGGTLGKWPHAGTEAAVTVRGASLSAWGRTRRLQGISWLVERSSDRRKTSLIFSVCPPWSQRLLSLGRGGLDLWGLVDSSSPWQSAFSQSRKLSPSEHLRFCRGLNVPSSGKHCPESSSTGNYETVPKSPGKSDF